MKKILVYRNGPHKSTKLLTKKWGIHEIFQMKKHKSIGKFFFFISEIRNMLKIRGFDIYFFEGFSPALFSFLIKRRDNKLIVKANDQLPYLFSKTRLVKYLFKISGMEHRIDGVIAVSEMIKNDYEQLFSLNKIIVCEGFIYRETKLFNDIVSDENRDFIFIGEDGNLKGLDINIKAFLHIRNKMDNFSDSRFYIIGGLKDYLKTLKFDIPELENKGVVFVGYTDDIIPFILKARYQLHVARYEPNAVSIMECMAMGVVPIISNKTGNKSFVSKLCPFLVLNIEDDSLFDNLLNTVQLVEDDYIRIKSEFVNKAKERYSLESGMHRWTIGYNELLND